MERQRDHDGKENRKTKVWDEDRDRLLRRHYPKRELAWIARRLGVTVIAVKSRAVKLGLRRKTVKRHRWTVRQVAYLRQHYADTPAEEIAARLKVSIGSVWRKAASLGIRKSSEYLAEQGRRMAASDAAKAHRFIMGHTSHNKGKSIEDYMSAEGIERSSRTRFKPGHRPHNKRDIGSEVVHGDGYVYVSTEDGCIPKHRLVWQQHHGEIPDDMLIAFRDGNRQNCDISNLEIISREENARRLGERETPEGKAARIAKARTTRNRTIRLDKIRIHWGFEPKTRLVKRW
jgi:hypothetical protein